MFDNTYVGKFLQNQNLYPHHVVGGWGGGLENTWNGFLNFQVILCENKMFKKIDFRSGFSTLELG